jgi:hypothetical protein
MSMETGFSASGERKRISVSPGLCSKPPDLLIFCSGPVMTSVITNLKTPALVSVVLVLPFVILELKNQRVSDFPIFMFVILWLLPVASLLILMPVVRDVRAGARALADPFGLLVRFALVAGIVYVWGSIVLDQMPCFLGVPNCD